MKNDLKTCAENNKILEIRSGSHLYGTNTPESDEDYLGIFMPPKEYVYGLKSVQEISLDIKNKNADGKNTAKAVDKKLYEFRKFIQLALGSNPNILEVLFVNKSNILSINDTGKALLDIRYSFLSKFAIPKFIGYAKSQKHKMIIRKDHFNDLQTAYQLLETLDNNLTFGQVYTNI